MTAPQTYSPASQATVAGLLRAGARRHPERELLVWEDPGGGVTSYSWEEVLEHAAGIAALLGERGIEPGQRVHLHLPNRPEFLFTWFAAALLGASIVPSNVACSAEELAYLIDHSEAAISIADAANLEVAAAARRRLGDDALLCCERDGLLSATAVDDPRASKPTADRELAILYTSGTTSKPKGVEVTHANYRFAGEVVSKATGLTPDDRLIVALPLFHANAQYYSTMGALTAGATIILLPRFSASRFIPQCVSHRATVASLFAAPIRMILAQDEDPGWREHGLRLVLFAQNVADEDLAEWDRRVGAPLLQLYGMTETIGPPLMNPLWGERRHDTLGNVSLGYSCRVLGDGGDDAGVGERGELLVGGVPGVSLTRGYLHDPDATAGAIRDGWLHTGDVVSVDDEGYFSFVDREKDMIKRAGENVAASEIEAVLVEHPAVADAAVVGVPDPMRDEAIVAFVVVAGGERTEPAELERWCAERLAKFRVPGDVVICDELPRTSVGKIQKHVLRSAYLAEQAEPAGRPG